MLVPKDAKSVLEIGAGSGKNCVIYPKDSYKVAIEPEQRTDCQTVDNFPGGFNEYHHVLYEDYKEDRKFDLIVMCDVLEHVNDPVDLINFCKDHLTPQGHILLSLPNFICVENILKIIITRDFRYVKVDQGEKALGVLDINHKTFWTGNRRRPGQPGHAGSPDHLPFQGGIRRLRRKRRSPAKGRL